MGEPTCVERVHRGRIGFGPCLGRVTATYEGKSYCPTHYPPNVARRRQEAQARYERHNANMEKVQAGTKLIRDLAPADPAAGAAALRALVEAAKFSLSVHRDQGLFDISEQMAAEQLQAALTQLEAAANGTR